METSKHIISSSSRFDDLTIGHPHLQIGLRSERGWLVQPDAPLRETIESPRLQPIPLAPGLSTVLLNDGHWWLRRIEYQARDGGMFTAYVALHVDPAQLLVARLRRWMLAAGMFGVLASGLLGWIVAKRGLAPIAAVARDAERVTAQHLGPFLRAEDAPSEIRGLIEAINRMMERLAGSFRTLEEFSADIAHELRTPLNNLMLQTQVTLSRPRSSDEYQDALHSNLEELESLQRMVSDMLFLARADRGMFELHVERVDLREEANKVAEFFEIAAAESGMTIEVTGEGQAICDRSMARRALTNLLSNAVRYSPAGSHIKVELHGTDSAGCVVDVTNPARTMGEEELRRLFGRFARGQAISRPLRDDGSGLGLSIVASIMRLHGGEALAESVAGGVRFRLVFKSVASGTISAS